jgi:hypothetical protein
MIPVPETAIITVITVICAAVSFYHEFELPPSATVSRTGRRWRTCSPLTARWRWRGHAVVGGGEEIHSPVATVGDSVAGIATVAANLQPPI